MAYNIQSKYIKTEDKGLAGLLIVTNIAEGREGFFIQKDPPAFTIPLYVLRGDGCLWHYFNADFGKMPSGSPRAEPIKGSYMNQQCNVWVYEVDSLQRRIWTPQPQNGKSCDFWSWMKISNVTDNQSKVEFWLREVLRNL